jgi:hypothetical protein
MLGVATTSPAPPRLAARARTGGTLRLALLLVLPTIGLEQILHTSGPTLPLYEVLHWLSDSLLALPLAALAVWSGQQLATSRGLGQRSLSDIVTRALLIALIFAVILVPGSALHDAADNLTHAHASLSIHAHVPLPTGAAGDPSGLASFLAHGLSDGVTAQAIGLPVLILAMVLEARIRRSRGGRSRVSNHKEI